MEQQNQNNQTPVTPNNNPPLNNPLDPVSQQQFTPSAQQPAQTSIPSTSANSPQNQNTFQQPPISGQDSFVPPQNPVTTNIPQEKSSHGFKKIAIVILILFILGGVVFFMSQSSFDFPSIVSDTSNQTQTVDQEVNQAMITNEYEGNDLQQNDQIVTAEGVVAICADVGVTVLSPNANEVFAVGRMVDLDWELCGISPQLIDAVVVDYFDPETNQKMGDINVFCTEGVSIVDETKLSWVVPPYVEPGTGNCSTQKEVDFADGYVYKFRVSYANQQYQSSSADFFAIDTSQFVYNPIIFADYSLEVDADFERVSSIADDAFESLKSKIFPSFFAAPPTFANYYRVFDLGCGTSCFAGAFAIDLRDGKSYKTPLQDILDGSFANVQVNSNLYIVELPGEEIDYQDRETLVEWYEFDEVSKEFNLLDTKLCNVATVEGEKEYQECIQP